MNSIDKDRLCDGIVFQEALNAANKKQPTNSSTLKRI